MRKVKTVTVVLLVSLVLIIGACIPELAARFMDEKHTGSYSINPMTSIELSIHQELSPVGKLAMMNRIDSLLPIRESKAGMTAEDVMAAVMKELAPYMDAQLVAFSEEHVEMQPYLVQVLDMPQLQSVIWQVTIAGDDADFTFVDLLMDDKTGHILRINYTAENPRPPYVKEKVIRSFADIYFSSLGITDHWNYLVKDLEHAFIGDNAVAVRFHLEDPQYGQADIDLFVHDNGFYIEFPTIE
ncbi:MAG: hypothetical protein E7438_07670 [Ruminococcaceae bacterium]|nr:hypothetical protein [Oscillospiraceae bacterium]